MKSVFKKLLPCGAALLVGMSSASHGQLLNDVLLDPSITFNADGTTTFTAADGSLVVDASPLEYTDASGNIFPIFNFGSAVDIDINLSLATDCSLVSGGAGANDLVVQGDVIDPLTGAVLYAGTLLTAEVLEQGFDAATDSFDYRFAANGGTLVDAGVYSVGTALGLKLTAEGAGFAGDCSVDWNGEAKGVVSLRDEPAPPEKCFDVKKVYIEDSVAYRQCYGYGGNRGSKFKVVIAAECEDGFDPGNDLISLSLDGETIEFAPGAFSQDVDNLAKFRARISGRPSVSAVLDCAAGKFSVIANRADVSQIDFDDGLDVGLVLGTWSKQMNVPLTALHVNNGYRLTWKYWNSDPADCSNPDYEPPACETNWESVKFKHVESGRYHTFDGGFGDSINVTDEYSDNDHATCSAAATIDSSCTTSVTCGDIIGGFKVIKIDHKNDSQSCDLRSHHDRYNDRWSWKRRRHW